jgi:hypothetical protein
MSESNNLIILLGAGFSAPAGFPLSSQIGARFTRNNIEMILRMSSSEWYWKDGKDENFTHNGSINYDYLTFSYILNAFVEEFISNNKGFENYESMYQYLMDNCNDSEFNQTVLTKAKQQLTEAYPSLINGENPQADMYLLPFERLALLDLVDIVNYLIADHLGTRSSSEILKAYGAFTSVIREYDTVSIFTLNHDLLLEQILEENRLKYSNGFTKENSEIFFGDQPLLSYQEDFTERIKIYKLHGGIGQYAFHHGTEHLSGVSLDGDRTYYYTLDYYAKHGAERKNPKTLETIQSINHDPAPKFLTGTDKMKLIHDDRMYSDFYSRFSDAVISVGDLLVIGYSFQDSHINQQLENGSFNGIININRSKDYPFDSIAQNLRSIKGLEGL